MQVSDQYVHPENGSLVNIGLNMGIFISSALAFVAALAWSNAFRNYFENHPKLKSWGPWVYASSVTLLAFLITYFIATRIQKAG